MPLANARPWIVAVAAAATAVATATVAADLPPHPRLLLTPAKVETIKARVATDPLVALVRDATIVSADKALDRRTCEYRIPDGKRLLAESRAAIDVVLHTATAWLLTGDRRYLDRCVKELDAACALPDWNPSHFLDTAEMATAVALGLDWLHPDLDAAQRDRYRAALVAKAIRPAEEVFATKGWWTKASNNWSQVCGAGIAVACAAVAEDRPALDASLFAKCLALLHDCERFYEGGGYPEGPAYWDYGTSYHVLGLAVADGLGEPIVVDHDMARSADFMAHLRGPSGLLFNFADAHPRRDAFVPARGWLIGWIPVVKERHEDMSVECLGRDLRRGLEANATDFRSRGSNDRFFPLHLLWLPADPGLDVGRASVGMYGHEQEVVTIRTFDDDRDPAFIAMKGGTPRASHGHMDVGSFVYDAHGRRWTHDLGGDDYNLPGYFGRERFAYFRLSARSHNVLLIDGQVQNPTCEPCTLPALACDAAGPVSGEFALSPAYRLASGPLAEKVTRHLAFDRNTGIAAIRDTVVAPVGDVRWQAMIDAEPDIDGSRVVLRKDGKAITLDVAATCTPPLAAPTTWIVEDAKPPTPREKQNEGFRLLSCTIPRAQRVEIKVTITPRALDP
ncbi:MAG: heparinase II/III family protein [Planctomycetaceae bacterium]